MWMAGLAGLSVTPLPSLSYARSALGALSPATHHLFNRFKVPTAMRAQTGQQTEDGQPIGVIRTRTAVCAPSQRVDDEIPSPRLLPYRPPVTAAEGGAPSGGDYTYTALPGDTCAPDARAWASMVAVGHGDSRHVVLIGGRKPRGQIHGPPVPCETLFVFDTARDCWQKLPTRGRAPSARFAAATSALGSSRLFLSGGIAAEGVRRDAFVLTLRRGGRSQAPDGRARRARSLPAVRASPLSDANARPPGARRSHANDGLLTGRV